MSEITRDPTNGWTAFTQTPLDGLAALLAQVIAQAERDITMALRGGYMAPDARELKRPDSDHDDYQAPAAVHFLKSRAAAELCELLVQWAGGGYDLRPLRRLELALDEGTRPSCHDMRSSRGAARDEARRMMSGRPSDRSLKREHAVTRERLPAHLERKLDAEGTVRGRTWRTMPSGSAQSRECQAINWALWKRGLEVERKPDGTPLYTVADERRAA
jgi:hypothetical protein